MQMRIADFVDYFKIQQNNNGGVFGMDMYQLLYDNLIQLNIHGDGTQQAGNIRLYEATGVGTLLLTDWKENINEIFIPDEEVIVFKDQNEALKKAAYYLRNEKEAKEISMNGQKRTISNYSAEKRIEQFIRVISNMLE
jgi:spore maturation protein CgeB